MTDDHGRFVWYEFMTTDTKAAEAFYTDVVGWTARNSACPVSATPSSGPAMPRSRA